MAGDDDNRTEIVVAAAALVVSVIAFAATFLQCLQQYLASARGYAQCNDKVIGQWATTKKRHFSFEELRFEVEFDAPVIFVCPPKNKNTPVPDTPMYKLDGTDESLSNTWTTINLNSRKDYKAKTAKERIHTADNERASWFMLLSAIQLMERESREWHEAEFGYKEDEPPKTIFAQHNLRDKPPELEDSHTLVVALQRKRKSWITMPPSISRPYATTTMCHLVEMMAVLGVYWKEFNRMNDRYRAEGNGFMVLGERVSDLGLMFSFQVNGLGRFGRNRVIPVDEIKELCFGWVPTIYRSQKDKRRLEVPIDLMDLSSLQMGSRREIAETLIMIGCNNNAVKSYLEAGRRTSHLFPLSFELLGMLSQTFHIKNTYFTFIPNPTPERWDSRSVSIVKMMESFGHHFKPNLKDTQRNGQIVQRIDEHIDNILSHLEDNNVERLVLFKVLHEALEDTDEILTGRTQASRAPPPESPSASEREGLKRERTQDFNLTRRFTTALGRQLHRRETSEASTSNPNEASKKPPPPGLSQETPAQRQRRETVQDVLRSHIQEVLRILNEREERANESTLPVPQSWGGVRSRSRSLSPEPSRLSEGVSMDDVDAAGPDVRQDLMMQLYCKHVRPAVVQSTARTVDRRASLRVTPFGRRGSGASIDTPVSPTTTHTAPAATRDTPAPDSNTTSTAGNSRPSPRVVVPPASRSSDGRASQQVGEAGRSTLAHLAISHDDIWCTLVFRMLCWLMLHDFNKLDIQVPKSELLGSRMPVYVA